MIAKFCHIKYNSTDIKKEERQQMRREKEIIGYLPQERPTTGKLLLYAIQQVIVMFPATVTVAS